MDDSNPTDFPVLPVGTPEDNLKLASDLAAINLLFVQQEIANRITAPTITSKMLLDFGEHSYKVSGMQKKQEVKDVAPAFVLNINMGDKTLHIAPERAIDAEVEQTPMGLVREAAAQGLAPLSQFALDIPDTIFDNAPEFK